MFLKILHKIKSEPQIKQNTIAYRLVIFKSIRHVGVIYIDTALSLKNIQDMQGKSLREKSVKSYSGKQIAIMIPNAT